MLFDTAAVQTAASMVTAELGSRRDIKEKHGTQRNVN